MSKLNRRDFMKLMASTGAGAMLSSMGPAGLQLLAQQAEVSGDIDFWHNFIAEFVFAGFEEVLADFHDLYPEITVNPLTIPNADFMTKFATSVIGGDAPDTTMAQPTRIPDMVAIDGLTDITDRVEAAGLFDEIPADRWEGATVDGRIYGVPSFMFVDWMYYRADWFEEAGIDPPTTFEEFTEAAIALTDPENGRYGFGMRGGSGGQGMVVDIIEAFGSPIIDDEGQPAMDREKVIEALTWYTELATVHGAVPPSVVNDSFRQIMEGFQTGQTAMLWHHTGSLAEMLSVLGNDGVFSTQTRPEGPAGLIARASANYNAISKPDPENEEAAWTWVSHWAEIDTQVSFLEKTGYFPTSNLVADDERVQSNPLYTAALATVNEVGTHTAFAGSPGWEQTVVLPAFQRILTEEITPEEAADLIIDGLEEAING